MTRELLRRALPSEHGSWAFVAEPLLIATMATRGAFWPGAVGLFLLFLAYRPGTLALRDLRANKRFPRTVPYAVAGGVLAAMGLALFAFAASPLLIGVQAAVGLAFVVADANLKPRALSRELLGSVLVLPAAVLAVLLEHPWIVAVLLIRPLAAVLSVRGILDRFDDGPGASKFGAVAGGVLLVAASMAFGPTDLRVFVYGLAGLRAIYLGVTRLKERTPVKVGIAESGVAAAVAATATG